jgi:hypothetical protein
VFENIERELVASTLFDDLQAYVFKWTIINIYEQFLASSEYYRYRGQLFIFNSFTLAMIGLPNFVFISKFQASQTPTPLPQSKIYLKTHPKKKKNFEKPLGFHAYPKFSVLHVSENPRMIFASFLKLIFIFH